jgi:hypothetical protein
LWGNIAEVPPAAMKGRAGSLFPKNDHSTRIALNSKPFIFPCADGPWLEKQIFGFQKGFHD